MIRVSVLYPNSEGTHFDEDYYVNNHLPMVADKLASAMVRYEIDKGISGATPGSPAPFVAGVHMFFDSLQSFQGAFGANAADHGRHPELHGHPADDPDQRSYPLEF